MTLKNTRKHDTVIYKVIKDWNILVKWNFYYSFPLVIVYVCVHVCIRIQISDKYEKIPFPCFVLYSDLGVHLGHSCRRTSLLPTRSLPLSLTFPPLPCRPWEHTYSPTPTLLILDQGVSNVAHLYYPQTPKTFPVL